MQTGSPSKLLISGNATPFVATCTAYTITSADAYSNTVPVVSQTNLTLGYGSGAIYTDGGCTTPATSANIAAGTSSVIVYFSDPLTESLTFSAQATGLTQGTLAVTTSSLAAQIAMTGNSQVTAGVCNTYVITSQDGSGSAQAVGAPITVALSGKGNGSFYSGSGCTGSITSTSIAAGTSSVAVYFKDTKAELLTLSAATTQLGSSTRTVTVNPAAPSTLVWSGTSTITTSACSAFTITTFDPYSNVSNVVGNTAIGLSGNGLGNFYSTATCSSAVTTTTMGSGSSSQTVYFADNFSGVESLTFSAVATGLTTGTYAVQVQPAYDLQNLVGNWDATWGNYSGPGTGNTWRDLTSNAFDATLGSAASWIGSGTYSNPYAVSFNGTNNSYVNFDSTSPLNNMSEMMFTTWVNSSVTTPNSVILGNSGASTGHGFSLRQSVSHSGAYELVVGESYQDVVLADSPVVYLRLGESSTANGVVDSSTNAQTGIVYGNTPTLGLPGAFPGDSNTAIYTNGNTYINVFNYANFDRTSTFSLEAWIKSTSGNGHVVGSLWYTQPFKGYELECLGGNQLGVWLISDYPSTNEIRVVSNTSACNDGNWHHLVMTYNGSSKGSGVALYDNGAILPTSIQIDNLSGSFSGNLPSIGTRQGGAEWYTGYLQEVAFYGTVLTPAQVYRHYRAGMGDYGGSCRTASTFSNSVWNSIGGIFNGSNLSMFASGIQQCSVPISSNFIFPQTGLYGGATSTGQDAWSGSMADLKLYATNGNSTVGTASNVYTNFAATADRYRATPVGNIVTNGLVFNLDAANATPNLISSYPNGCLSNELNWYDLSSLGLTGALTNFSNCGPGAGWNGDGTTVVNGINGPYRLTFNGNNYVHFPSSPLSQVDNWTLSAWIYPTDLSNTGMVAIHLGNDWADGFGISASGATAGRIGALIGGIVWADTTTSYTLNKWHYVAVVRKNGTLTVYLNDSALSPTYTNTPNVPSNFTRIGTGPEHQMVGSVNNVMVYNRALSTAEITQNCNVQQARVGGGICQ